MKSQLYPSLSEAITLLASQETLSSSGEQPRAPQRWKNPPTVNDCRQEEVLDYFRHYRDWVLLLLVPGKLQLFLSSFMSLIPAISSFLEQSLSFFLPYYCECSFLLEGGRALGQIHGWYEVQMLCISCLYPKSCLSQAPQQMGKVQLRAGTVPRAVEPKEPLPQCKPVKSIRATREGMWEFCTSK